MTTSRHLRLPEDELTVGGEGLGPVDQLHDVGVAHHADETRTRLGQRWKRSQSVGSSGLLKSGGWRHRRTTAPGRAVAADDQPADLLPEVDEPIGIADGREPRETVAAGRVMAYWWAIGTTGTTTPTSRPIS